MAKTKGKAARSTAEREAIEHEIDAAIAAGEEAGGTEPRAVSARYERKNKRLIIELRNGVVMMVPTELMQGLVGASDEDIAALEIEGGGYALHWKNLDADFTVPGLVAGIFGTKKWMRELTSQFMAEAGRKGGLASTHAKQAASRENGKLGGRPRLSDKPRKTAGRAMEKAA